MVRVDCANRWLITAPAGFGKTAFLCELAQGAVDDGASVTWLSFDEQSTSQETVDSLIESAERAGLDITRQMKSSSVGAFLGALGSAEGTHWILLDELDRAPESVLSVVDTLLDGCPDSCCLILAGRNRLRTHFAKARSSGALLALRADDLRFSPSEVAALMDLSGRDEGIDSHALSDGWPVAAVLLANGYKSNTDRPTIGDTLIDFVHQEIVSELTASECEVLVRCSLIRDLSHDDIEVLVGGRDGHAAIFSAFGKLEGLIKSTASAPLTYKLNPVVAGYFRLQISATMGKEATDIIKLAAERLIETGRAPEAAELARDVHDIALFKHLLQRQTAVDLWGTHGTDELRRILPLAGKQLRTTEPQLLLMGAIVDLKEGRIAEAESRISAAAEAWPPLQPRSGLEIIELGLTLYGCRPFDQEVRSRLDRLLAPGHLPNKWLTMVQSAACLMHLQMGDLAQATKMAVAALDDRPYGDLFLNYHMSSIAAVQGDIKRARDLLRNGRSILRTRFAEDKGGDTVATILSAELDYELGRLPTARSRIRLVEGRVHRMEAWFDVYAGAFATCARLLLHDLGLLAAIEYLTVNAACLRGRDLPIVADHLEVLCVLIRAQAGLSGRGEDTPLNPPSMKGWDQMGWRAREAISLARAAVLLMNADPNRASMELDRLIAFAKETGVRRTELRALLMVCEAAEAVGDSARAAHAFEAAIQIGLITGFRRSFKDYCGPCVLERLKAMGDSQSAAARFARSILQGDPIHAGLEIRLTRREQDVLQAIEVGGSDKTVARRLGVSEHAVRFHLKNIFQKLKAHSRAEAIQTGLRLGAFNVLEPIAAEGRRAS